jgi:hypothetical protein
MRLVEQRQGLAEMRSHPAGRISAQERGRRQIVRLVMLIYLLLIFEGALRKWVLASYGQILFFVRDPFVLGVYWLALKHSLYPKGSRLLIAGLGFGCIGFLIITLQAIGVASGIDQWPILALYGWRNYFLYIPLPFIVGQALGARDVERIIKMTLVLAVPIALLVLIQFRSSPEAPINIGFGVSIEQQYHGLGLDADHTRPMGTYTSDVGQNQFDVCGMAMLLSLWVLPAARRFVKSWQLLVATCALLTCLAVSGSRGAMIGSGLVAATALASSVVLKGSGVSARAILLPTMIVGVAVVAYPLVFPDGYEAFVNRWNGAAAVESQAFGLGVFGRALYSFVDFLGLMGDAPIFGYGLGLAGNASLTLGVTIPGFNGWAESDWARHIVDLGPIFGVAFILYRVTLVTWLGLACLRSARSSGSPLPLLLYAYVAVGLLYGELTGHGTINGYDWLFAGLCLAASRTATQPSVARDSATLPGALHRPLFANLQR